MHPFRFSSSERPTRIAKALTRAFEASGHPFPHSKIREATAVMFGYRNWNDLLGQVGKHSLTALDQDVSSAEADARRVRYIASLKTSLGAPAAAIAAVVDQVGPSSSAKKPGDLKGGAWQETIERLARGFEAMSFNLSPVSEKELQGFEFWVKRARGERLRGLALPDQYGYRLLTGEDGSLKFVSLPLHAPGSEDDAEFDGGEFLGRMLQKAGLLSSEVPPSSVNVPYIRETLSRLDGKAVQLLQAVRSFDTRAYDLARSLPNTSAFRAAVEEAPMLGAVLTHRAHAEANHYDYPNEPTTSSNPLQAFAAQAEAFAAKRWQGLEFDPLRAQAVIGAVGRVVVLHDLGLLPWHIAFLSYAPDDALPKTPGQMKAAMGFIEAATDLFGEGMIAPHDFYREFEERHGNDWARIDTLRGKIFGLSLYASEIGDCVAAQFIAESGEVPEEDGNDKWGVGRAIFASLAAGKGFSEALEMKAQWDDDLEADVGDRFAALRSKLLPEWAADLSVTELLARFGFEPDHNGPEPILIRTTPSLEATGLRL